MDDGIDIGSFVLFFQHGELVGALCTARTGSHLQVLCAGGQVMSLAEQRVVHVQPFEGDPGTVQAVARMAALEECQKQLAACIDPESLWKILPDVPCEYTSRELARIAFGEAACVDHAAAVVRALQHDHVYFKFNGQGYRALDAEQTEHSRARAEREQELREEIERCSAWLHAFVNSRDLDNGARHLCARYLLQFAVFGTSAPQYPHIRTIIRQAGLSPGRRECFNILVRMGVCSSDENLLLARYGVPSLWPDDALREVETLIDPHAQQRSDAVCLETWSIDDPGTRDIDDAISFEQEGGLLRVGVHITDAASQLAPGCALDREAARRGTSLYLPEGAIAMLPPEVSEKRLSLIAGQERPVVSIFVSIDASGHAVKRSLRLSTVRVKRRLSYEDVNDDIRCGGPFKRLYGVMERVRAARRAAGASSVSIPEMQVRLNRDREVVLRLRERETPAQALVAECMILANHSAALFLRTHAVPALFRTQKPSRAADAPGSDDMSLAERLRLRRAFNRTVIETRPCVHAGLGLDCYCSITSPMRKYLDLVMQRQLVAAVLGRPPVYPEDQLRDISVALQPVLTRASLVESERRRYWLFKKMEPLKGRELQAIVLARRKKNYTVLLKDFLFEAQAEPIEDISYEPGRDVQVLLRDIDPFEGTIGLSVL